MEKRLLLQFVASIFILSTGLAADADYLPTPGKVAFIGNSLTMFNCGSDNVVKRLGDAMSTPLKLTINQGIQVGGYTLKDHWTSASRSVISNGNFNVVVMQEGGDWTYSTNPANAEQFYQYGKLWADAIRKAGATPTLYMMWAWQGDVGEAMKRTTDHHAALYDNMAQLIHAKVIPIGRGYYKLRNDPSPVAKSINLFVDYQHPSASATYFIGCIAFAALYDISPVGNSYLGADTACQSSPAPTKAQAEYMQTLAWETWQQYGGDDGGLASVPPSVSIEFQRDNLLTLRWPDWVNGWLPYSATSLAPLLLWLPVTNAVSRSNGQSAVMLSPGAGSGFFRLSRP